MITQKDIVLKKGLEVVCKKVNGYTRYFRCTYNPMQTQLRKKRAISKEEYQKLKRLWKKKS